MGINGDEKRKNGEGIRKIRQHRRTTNGANKGYHNEIWNFRHFLMTKPLWKQKGIRMTKNKL